MHTPALGHHPPPPRLRSLGVAVTLAAAMSCGGGTPACDGGTCSAPEVDGGAPPATCDGLDCPGDGGSPTVNWGDGGIGPSLRLPQGPLALLPGTSWPLSVARLGPPTDAGIRWSAQGSATVSQSGVVSQPDTGPWGETRVTACLETGAAPACDSMSILPFQASALGQHCDGLTPCPSPFTCASYAPGPGGSGFCTLACLSDPGCGFGFTGAGQPQCDAASHRCAIACTQSQACPGSLRCVDLGVDAGIDLCADVAVTSWPPAGQGAACQADGDCALPSLACTGGHCQAIDCPAGSRAGDRCALSQPGDGVCTPMPDQRLRCVLAGASTTSCDTTAARGDSASRCVGGMLCVTDGGVGGSCQAACASASDCQLDREDCVVPNPGLPALQTCQPRRGSHPTCLGTASLSLSFVYQEPRGTWGERLVGGTLADVYCDGKSELVLPVPDGGLQVIGAIPGETALEVRQHRGTPPLRAVRVGDVIGNGYSEIVGFDSSQAFVLDGRADAGLALLATVPLVPGIELAAVGEVSGDWIADLVVASAATNELALRAAVWGGGFAPVSTAPLADGGVGHLLLEDCDGDFKNDIISIGPDVVSVWKGGATSLGSRVDTPHGLGGSPATQLLADFNGDGRTDVIDVVTTQAGTQLRVLEAQAGCAFSLVTFPLLADPLAESRPVAVLDTNADWYVDLLVTGRDLDVERLGGLSGGFGPAETWVAGAHDDAASGPLLRPPGLATFGLGKVDGLSGLQLVRVVGSTVEALPVGLPPRLARSLGGAFRSGPVVSRVDLNGDGVLDAVGRYGLTASGPDAGWSDLSLPFASTPAPDGGNGWAVRGAADVDRDGVADLLVDVGCGAPGAHLVVAKGQGDGTFSPLAASTCTGPGSFRAVMDWDGVNGPDVLCQEAGGLVPYLNDGSGNLTATLPEDLAATLPGVVGDFDGDHRDDVVFEVMTGPSSRALAVLFMDSSMEIEEPAGYSLKPASLGSCGGTPALLAVDLDGDGAQELAGVLTGPQGDLLLLWRAATNAVELRRLPARAGPVAGLAAGDLDGDRAVDLLVSTAPPRDHSWSAPSAQVYFGDGAGGLGPPRGLSVDTFDESVSLVDLDGDGKPEVVMPRDPGTSTAVAWPNRCQ